MCTSVFYSPLLLSQYWNVLVIDKPVTSVIDLLSFAVATHKWGCQWHRIHSFTDNNKRRLKLTDSVLLTPAWDSNITKKADREIKNASFKFLKTVNRKVWASLSEGSSDDWLQCEVCDSWHHASCVDVSKATFDACKKIKKITLDM